MLTSEQKIQCLDLNKRGFSNRKIADLLNLNHRYIGIYFKEKNIKLNVARKKKVNFIDNFNFLCSKCFKIKKITNHQTVNGCSYCLSCRTKQTKDNINRDGYKVLVYIFNRLKARCKKQNINFDLDFNYFKNIFDIQEGKCFYCEEQLCLFFGNKTLSNKISIDKVIPTNGYTKGNIVFCTTRFNTIKSNLSLSEIEKYMPNWYDKLINTKWLNLGVLNVE